jgi:hypothetical protein
MEKKNIDQIMVNESVIFRGTVLKNEKYDEYTFVTEDNTITWGWPNNESLKPYVGKKFEIVLREIKE